MCVAEQFVKELFDKVFLAQRHIIKRSLNYVFQKLLTLKDFLLFFKRYIKRFFLKTKFFY